VWHVTSYLGIAALLHGGWLTDPYADDIDDAPEPGPYWAPELQVRGTARLLTWLSGSVAAGVGATFVYAYHATDDAVVTIPLAATLAYPGDRWSFGLTLSYRLTVTSGPDGSESPTIFLVGPTFAWRVGP
jgi:hypothetical protein